jgi:hypothetical protein
LFGFAVRVQFATIRFLSQGNRMFGPFAPGPGLRPCGYDSSRCRGQRRVVTIDEIEKLNFGLRPGANQFPEQLDLLRRKPSPCPGQPEEAVPSFGNVFRLLRTTAICSRNIKTLMEVYSAHTKEQTRSK